MVSAQRAEARPSSVRTRMVAWLKWVAIASGFAVLLFGGRPSPHAQDQNAKAVKPQDTNPEQALANSALTEADIPNPGDANIKHGLDIVTGNISCPAGQTCYPCSTCHQIRGEGAASSEFPRLTGQSYRYLYASLKAYASGARQSDVMAPVAKALTDNDMRDVAGYYAAEALVQSDMAQWAAAQDNPKADVLADGATLAAIGSAEKGVQGCVNCHGPAGAGLPPVYPYLAGQYAGYLEDQLKAFKSGSRKDDALGIMRNIAGRLSDDEIHAVAQYYASIRPPVTVPQTSFAGPVQIGAPLGTKESGNKQGSTQ